MGRITEWKLARRARAGKPRVRTAVDAVLIKAPPATRTPDDREPPPAVKAGRGRANARVRLPRRLTTGRRNAGRVRRPLRPSFRFTDREYSRAELRCRSAAKRVVRHSSARAGSWCWLRLPIPSPQPRAARPAATASGQMRRHQAS